MSRIVRIDHKRMTIYYKRFEQQVFAMAIGYILGLLTALMIAILAGVAE